jgi:tetratricopeptide (TPR) repeat protein
MEYVDGRSLGQLIRSGPLPIERAVRYGIEAADALAHAHNRGVIHGDLKASNVIVSAAGRLKIVDFGIARRIGWPTGTAVAPSEAAIRAVGTPYVMAPEQVRGDPPVAVSDVWALGVLLFEMIVGQRPFDAPTVPELFVRILRNSSPPLPEHVPKPLADAVSKCLAKSPAHRYQRAADLRLVLEVLASELGRVEWTGSPATSGGARLPPPRLIDTAGGTEFVGRSRECDQLAEIWRRAKRGNCQVVLVGGEPGIGKTRLSMQYARMCADQGATILVGRSSEEALVPYEPFVEALSWYVRVSPEPDLRAALDTSGGGAELAQLLPDIIRRCPTLPTLPATSSETHRYRLFETVASFLAALSAAHPLLLVFEDLHWADKPALLMLRHVLRASSQARLCVIGTYRDSELARTQPLADMLVDLRREPGVSRLLLRGLEPGAVDDLLASLVGRQSSEVVQLISENTGGNPFFVGELVQHLQEYGQMTRLQERLPAGTTLAEFGVPQSIKEVIGRRVARTSTNCARALSLAAAIGREFDIALVAALEEFTEDQLIEALDEAVRARLVEESPASKGRLTFVHALIRETLYGELTSSRRVRLHRRIGEALERLAGDRPNPPLADLAYHFVQAASAGVADKAIDYATRAGDRAADMQGYEEATRFYEMALQSLEFSTGHPSTDVRRLDLHTRRASAFGAIAQWAAEKREAEEALQYLDPDQIERRAELLLTIANAAFFLLDIPSVQHAATEGLSLSRRAERSDLTSDAFGWLGMCRQAEGKVDEAIELHRKGLATGPGRKDVALMNAPLTLYLAGRTTEALLRSAEATELARSSVRDVEFTTFSLSHYGLSLGTVGRYADAATTFDEARQFAKKHGAMAPLARAVAMSACFHLSVHDFDGAEALQLEACDLARSVDFLPTVLSASFDFLLTLARRRDPGRAESLLAEMSATMLTTPGWNEWLWRLRMSQARAELALCRGDTQTAEHHARATIRRSRTYGRPKYEALGLITRAQALHALGRTRDAVADAQTATGCARQTEDPALLLWALDTLLALDGTDEQLAEARALSQRIERALPDETMKRRFIESEVVSHLARF